MRNFWRNSVGISTLLLVASGCGGGGSSPPSPLIAAQGTHYGHTYQDLAGAWWAWALAQSYDVNPIVDADGSFGDAGQPADVWFLAGTGGGSVDRRIWIPEGRPIFFPLLNQVWVTFTGIDPPFSTPGAEAAARDAIKMTGLETLTLTIDGVPYGNLLANRAQSPVFSVTVPEWNWFDGAGNSTAPGVLGAGTYPECVADGYWAFLNPLPRGVHTIHFTGDSGAGFTLDVMYDVAVY